MPLYNFTLDDTSAMFQYSNPDGSQWTDSPTSDPGISKYWSGTYHSSPQYKGTAMLRFQGVAVYLYDAKRLHHGEYMIYLDGQFVYTGNLSSLIESFQVPMYSARGLTPGWHNLTIVNNEPSDDKYTGIDFVNWTTSMSPDLNEVRGKDIPHSPENMTYSSSVAWTEESDGIPTMVTSTNGASVSINFQGNGIILSGKTGPTLGAFSAQVDDYDVHELSSLSNVRHFTTLFRQDGLPDGNHTLTVTNRSGSSLSIGSATPVYWSATSSIPTPSSSATSASKSNMGLIVGAAVGGVVLISLISLAILWALRRRRRRNRQGSQDTLDIDQPAPAFIHSTPFVLPPSPEPTPTPSNMGSPRDSKFRGPSMYDTIPGSPGMSSRGSLDIYGHSGPRTVSGAGSSAGWAGPKDKRQSGSAYRDEISQHHEEIIRDR
ncbi:hypothetical protein BDV93DRAFT_315978 [Ceratobasidium sp. AG-I]|nr:hypothetical protein BDV93DRAFT_315978 [Ceratobasidium sp. AG-I]